MSRAKNAKREAAAMRIQTLEIIDRLNACALGNASIESTELRCAEILLRKTLPDMKATDITTDGDKIEAISWSK